MCLAVDLRFNGPLRGSLCDDNDDSIVQLTFAYSRHELLLLRKTLAHR